MSDNAWALNGDHSKAHKEIAKAGIDIYLTSGTAEMIGAEGHRIHTIETLKTFRVGDFKILAFDSEHDCNGSVGYLIQCQLTGEKILFLTDSYYCKYRFKNLTQIAIEINYSEELLSQNVADGKTN